jgi:hypothetical protein
LRLGPSILYSPREIVGNRCVNRFSMRAWITWMDCAEKYRYRPYIGFADILLTKISISYRFKNWDIDPPLVCMYVEISENTIYIIYEQLDDMIT